MVQDVDAFCLHPWGRESFLKTITCMKPPKFIPLKCEDPIATLVDLLKQETFRLKGFPLSLQLLAFQAVPELQSIIPAPLDSLSIIQLEEPHLPVYPKISYLDILRVEAVENLAVTSLIPIQSQPQPGWRVWHDVVADERLTYMENLIANHHPFKKHLWPGGDTSTPILIHKPPLEEPETRRQVSKNALRPRKPLNKPPPCRKQRRISNYFLRTGSTSNSNDQMMEMLSKVSSEVSKLRKEFRLMRQLNKRKKSRTHSKRSAFHSLIGSPHKPQLSHRGCQTDPTEHSTDDVPNETFPTPMEEDHPECTSPVVSQYAAQLYGQPSSESTPVHTTHLPTEPEQTTPENLSDEEVVELSDSSPVKPTPRHQPSDEECNLAEELFKCPSIPALALIAPLPQQHWDLFHATLTANTQAFHITPSQFDFSNRFILEIAQPQKWVTTFHMEILMYMLAGRHRELLDREKLAFTTPYLASGIQEVFKGFKKLARKDRFKWDTRLTELVLQPGKKWMEDVFTIYTPMIWEDRHWVGLAINLDMGYVEILDPLPTLYGDNKVQKLMDPILTSLPYLVKKVAKPQQTQFRGLKPFHWERITGSYINERSGDCGPVSIKFMELHSHGDPLPHMSGITDGTVDDLR
ncbi:unnamed protein product [Brassica rapa subsp. trilocularis]